MPWRPLLRSAVAGTFQLLLRNQGAQRMSQSRSQTHLPAGGSGGSLRWAGNDQSTQAARVPAAPTAGEGHPVITAERGGHRKLYSTVSASQCSGLSASLRVFNTHE